ncbi:MAG: hypothetical protein ACRDL7_09145 [Gaiellaceae bacterium]
MIHNAGGGFRGRHHPSGNAVDLRRYHPGDLRQSRRGRGDRWKRRAGAGCVCCGSPGEAGCEQWNRCYSDYAEAVVHVHERERRTRRSPKLTCRRVGMTG